MAILTWCLYLVVTLLISVPFILFTSGLVFEMYFKYKGCHILAMVKTFADIALKTVKHTSAKKEKENDSEGNP